MTSFIALYRGETVSGARLVALTADPHMVQDFVARLIADEDLRPDLRPVNSSRENKGIRKGPNLLAEEPGQTQKGLHDSIPS